MLGITWDKCNKYNKQVRSLKVHPVFCCRILSHVLRTWINNSPSLWRGDKICLAIASTFRRGNFALSVALSVAGLSAEYKKVTSRVASLSSKNLLSTLLDTLSPPALVLFFLSSLPGFHPAFFRPQGVSNDAQQMQRFPSLFKNLYCG